MEAKILDGEPLYMQTDQLFDCTERDMPDEIYTFKVVRAVRYDALEARCRELEAAIDWVMNDAKYKAPEQLDAFMVGRWIATLYAARCHTLETDGKA